jgi:transposase
MFPFIERIFADGGYAGQKMALVAWRTGTWRLQIVKRSDAAGFEVLPTLDCRANFCLDQSQSTPSS